MTLTPLPEELRSLFRRHDGDPSGHGWRVQLRHRWGYWTTDSWYQAVVDRLVGTETSWLDVGGGRTVLPHNASLASELAQRCRVLVSVDPSENVDENELASHTVRSTIEDFEWHDHFDLATLRMVAEHIEEPERVVASLAGLIKPGGHVVVYTPCKWSPLALAATIVPDRWHHVFTGALWKTDPGDVFPTRYRMNTRSTLRDQFERRGFREVMFARLDNVALLQRWRIAYACELAVWRAFRRLRLRYPEADLLGVYEFAPEARSRADVAISS